MKSQIEGHPELFSGEEALELLPLDLREQVAAAPQPPVEVVPIQVSEISPKVVTDLTVKMLGPVELLRDPTRPLAADAWPTRRAPRHSLLHSFAATSPGFQRHHHRHFLGRN